MEYRKLKSNDIDEFIKNRIEFVTLIRKIYNIDIFKEKTLEYLKNHINSDDLIIYGAFHNNKIVSSCMLCIYQSIPLPSCYNGKFGELLNVYTKSEYRRQGHSAKIIKLLINEAKSKHVSKIVLEYTQEGYPLYKSLGFTQVNNYMEYTL